MKNIFLIALISTFALLSSDAFSRAGGGRSFGGRGSRSGSAPMQRYSPPPSRPQPSRPAPANPMNPNPAPQPPSGGGFFRNFGAGLAGGFLGSMLFRSFGGGGFDTGGGGGGFGFLELILLVGILFMAFRFFRNRMQPAPDYQGPMGLPTEEPSHDSPFIDKDTSLDIFFRVQSAYMNRDLTPIRDLMTSEVNDFLQRDVDALLASHQIDKLENIAVRDAEVVEQWQEEGKDWATVHFTANVIDYTIDERTQEVISGSKTTSVKFEEYWTLVRPSGSGPSQWKLSAIQQK